MIILGAILLIASPFFVDNPIPFILSIIGIGIITLLFF